MPLGAKIVVIDESLVLKCIQQSQIDVTGATQNSDDVEFNELKTLRLSFESIFKIDNLENFVKLQTLSLDNNMIENIQNLDSLVNLTWLDLSFNQITTIEGLETLTKLTDLSLFHNKLTDIVGLDQCTNLHVLSLGQNQIKNLDCLKTLRKFPLLEVVNFAGNPVCSDSDYKSFALAYLKHLRYLDYVLIEKKEVIAAKEQFQDFLQELEEKESLEEKSSDMKKSQGDQFAKIKDANLDMVDQLLQNMLKDDTEHDKLIHLPFLRDLLDDYQAQYTVSAENFKTTVLEVNEGMVLEVGEFMAALSKARHASTQRVIKYTETFNRKKKHTKRKITVGTMDASGWQKALEDVADFNKTLRRELLELESETVEDFDDLIGTFEVRFDELKLQMLDKYQVFFRGVEAMENSYSESVINKTTELIEDFSADAEMAVDENVAILLQDKESLMTSVVTSNDIHIGKLLALEDEMRERFMKKCTGQLKGLYSEEKARNRARVVEVDKMTSENDDEIKSFRMEWVDQDEDYG